jgi:hypothetical protein
MWHKGHVLQYKDTKTSKIIRKDKLNKVIMPRTKQAVQESDVTYTLTKLMESLGKQDIIK